MSQEKTEMVGYGPAPLRAEITSTDYGNNIAWHAREIETVFIPHLKKREKELEEHIERGELSYKEAAAEISKEYVRGVNASTSVFGKVFHKLQPLYLAEKGINLVMPRSPAIAKDTETFLLQFQKESSPVLNKEEYEQLKKDGFDKFKNFNRENAETMLRIFLTDPTEPAPQKPSQPKRNRYSFNYKADDVASPAESSENTSFLSKNL
jgi:hypothetical protein